MEDSKARVVAAEAKTEVLRAEIRILQQDFGKSEAEATKLEKAAAEGKKKQSQTIVNLKNETRSLRKPKEQRG